MTDDFKTTVSRTLTTENRQYTNVVWQAGKPPLDSELNLVGQIATDNLASVVSANALSGILMNPRSSDRDFMFNPLWSNYLKIRPFKALVNGLIVNVEETTINLSPPPAQDSRVDFVFLEVWKTIISSDGSGGDITNKPTSTTVYSNGNRSGSGLPDQMVDSNVGFETTKRVQVQYRFRVVDDIDIHSNIEGMSSSRVEAQGPLANVVEFATFNNQHSNGDSGLWVADMTATNSSLLSENVIYALPICAISRRNNNVYVAVGVGVNANQNGAITRTPSSQNSSDAVLLNQATLTGALNRSIIGNVEIANLVGSGLDDANLYGSSRYLVIGDHLNKEIIKVSGIDGDNIVIESRGVGGTQAKYHPAGSNVVLFNNRPDNKYSDEIHRDDLFDMRHATILGDWDYQSLLESSLSDLIFGDLRSSFKQNQINSTCRGPVIEEVSVLDNQVGLSQVHELDHPNGFRDTWSDASVPQMGITLYLSLTSTDTSGLTTTTLDTPNETNWEIGPDLNPVAFLYDDSPKMRSGSFVKLTLNTTSNLTTGVNKAQNPTKLTEVGMRFIAPKEVRDTTTKRAPFTIEEVGAFHRPLSYPTLASNFENPFIVLGRSRYTSNFTTSVAQNATDDNYVLLYQPTAHTDSTVVETSGATQTVRDLVVAIRLVANNTDVPEEIRNLESLITSNGTDLSGSTSELYVVIHGDPANQKNNGVFKVINILNDDSDTPNAVFYTDDSKTPWAPTSKVGFVILKPIDDITRTGGLVNNKTLTVEFRTQEITDLDENVMIAITNSTAHDIANGTLGQLSVDSEFQLGVSVLYPSTSSGLANVADNIHKIGIVPPTQGLFLNNSKSVLQGNDFASLPLVENEIDLSTKNHVSLWNRLPSSNLPIGVAQATQMGGRIINEESDREAEAFIDEKSKTVVLRPYQNKTVIINKATQANLSLNSVSTLVPTRWNNGTGDFVDDSMFLSTKDSAYVLPETLMPRFGRQDIPFHIYTDNSDTFRNGLNHIFIDKPLSTSDSVFNIIGGKDNGSNGGVSNVLFITGETYGRIDSYASINNRKAIGALKRSNNVNELNVPTSDFGSTLQGIELPPYYGVARIYGVYEKDLFNTHLAQQDNLGGHESNRINGKAELSSCPNLLREDATDFTLYINQNGGNDLVNNTSYTNAHTYVLTEHAIDITRLQGVKQSWNESSVFSDFDYVVEAVVFMFSDGFISHNRYVLPRNHNGSGTQLVNTTTDKITIDSVIPFAPPLSSHISIAYKRTLYQGDPFGTQGQLDQVVPQGRKSVSELVLGTRSQPVNLANTNKRNLEVLASMDFYTTLGTGKIGGEVYNTTITDVGYTPFPENRNPSQLISEQRTHISLNTSTFTEDYTQYGGWVSLFLFEVAEAVIKDKVTLALYKNATSISTLALTHNTVRKQVIAIMDWLQDLNFNNFQIRSELNFDSGANKDCFGILIQAPNPVDNYEIEIQWKDHLNGQEIQVFEGLRESPLSFEMFNVFNYEYKLNNRSKNRVSFSKIDVKPLNAGDGNIPISLVGMTSRLPLGSLVRDSDFVCEDILNNKSSYLFSSTGSFSTISNPVPVSSTGVPYTQTLGISGDVLQMNDGEIYHRTTPATQTKYSIARGGGSVFGVGGTIPGAPLSFLASSFENALQPVLKGSALACRAMLVRNFYEEDDSQNTKSYGNELQLLVVTHAIDGNSDSITLGGDISPAGYGEGFASADRFRIKGKPLSKTYGQNESLDVDPATYNSSN